MKTVARLFLVTLSFLLAGCHTLNLGPLGNAVQVGYVKQEYKNAELPNRSGVKVINRYPDLAMKVSWKVYYQPERWDPLLQKERWPILRQTYPFPAGDRGASLWNPSPRMISKYEFVEVIVMFIDSCGREVGQKTERVYPGGEAYWYREISPYPG